MAVTTDALVAEWVAKLATGTSPGVNTPTFTSTWVDLVGSDDIGLGYFIPSTADGWAGSGSDVDPYRLVFSGAADPDNSRAAGDATIGNFGTGDFSVEAWFFTPATMSNNNTYTVCKGAPSGTSGFRFGFASDGIPQVLIGDTVGYTQGALGTTAMSASTLYHFVITYDRSANAEGYINGSSCGTRSISTRTGTIDNADTLSIGGESNGAMLAAIGLATVRLYSKVLSSGEVSANYAAGSTAASTDGSWTGLTVIRDVHA